MISKYGIAVFEIVEVSGQCVPGAVKEKGVLVLNATVQELGSVIHQFTEKSRVSGEPD